MARRFLTLGDAGADGLTRILAEAAVRKAARVGRPRGAVDDDAPLAGCVLGMVFEKSSTRTRVSFDMAMRQMGGSALILDGASSQLGRGETVADTARVLGRYIDAIMIRTDTHDKAVELAEMAGVPVINGLTDLAHPCQLLADMQTVIEARGSLAGTRWAWVGDGNNVCNSLIEAASLLDFGLTVATPDGFAPDPAMVALASADRGIQFTSNPAEAVAGADVVVTDTWISMGQDEEAEYRRTAFDGYRVDDAMMAQASPGAHFLHCLPAHRGEEVTDAVIDGPASLVFDEAENRLHAQKALLRWAFAQI